MTETSITPPSTPRGLIGYATRRFKQSDLWYGHGTDNPFDEAVYLVLRCLGLPFDTPDTILDQSLPDDTRARVLEKIEIRISDRVPVAYLVNEAWFAGLPFYVDQRVLVPRSPMAELIGEKFAPWLDADNVMKILDLGTGSGSIAISCALAFPQARVTAVDIDTGALAVAAVNTDRHNLSDRVTLVQSDLFDSLPVEAYELIISNPPYVGSAELTALPPEYRHEPGLALLAGADGLDCIRRILAAAGRYLAANGILIVECGNSREAVELAFPDLPVYWLEFEHGGDGVFLLQASDLVQAAGKTRR